MFILISFKPVEKLMMEINNSLWLIDGGIKTSISKDSPLTHLNKFGQWNKLKHQLLEGSLVKIVGKQSDRLRAWPHNAFLENR